MTSTRLTAISSKRLKIMRLMRKCYKTARPKLSLARSPRYSMRMTNQKLRQRVLGLKSTRKTPIRRNSKLVILTKDKLWLRSGTRLNLRKNRGTRLSSLERSIYNLRLSRAAKTRTKGKIPKPLMKSQSWPLLTTVSKRIKICQTIQPSNKINPARPRTAADRNTKTSWSTWAGVWSKSCKK